MVAQVAHIQEDPEGPVVDTETRYIHSDGQGSAVLVTNQSGTTVAELFYDPFGRRTDINYDPLAGMVPARPGYTGHTHDDELGLIDMKGRVYDIDARRFLTPDPFIPAPLFSQSHNRYSYVWNNPATLVDPTGFDPDGFETDTTCFLFFCWTNSSAGDGSVGGGTTGDGGGLPNGTSTPELAPGSGPAGGTPSASDASGTSPFEHQGSEGGQGRASGSSGSSGTLVASPGYTNDPGSGVCTTVEGCEWQYGEVGIGYGREGPASRTENMVVGLLAGGLVVAAVAPELLPVILGRLGYGSVPGSASVGAMAAPGYKTFEAFKYWYGNAGPGEAWHHVVEQTAANIARFGTSAIHTANNLFRVAEPTHRKISGFYSSVQPLVSGSVTVREWLSTQSYQFQHDFGIAIMRAFGAIK